ncbi:MAG: SDR family oxidoreductase, partial [Planctomycetales bacterium]|nr:SDR family oxidoreductase [Planctomycetales bacterium]
MGRVLVTGASGFLGAHVVAHLTQSGEDVTCLVRASSSLDRLTAWQVRFVYG